MEGAATFGEVGDAAVSSGGFAKLQEPFCLNFSMFSKAEVEKLSVKEITSMEAFDALGHALPDGLYDPLLGPTNPSEGQCPTCALSSAQCPGHLGHIKLSLPVYNPALFTTMVRLIGLKCFTCHQFRMASNMVREFQIRLLLLEANLLSTMKEFQLELGAMSSKTELANAKYANINELMTAYEHIAMKALYDMDVEESILADGMQRVNAARERSSARSSMDIHCRTEWRETVKEFYAKVPSRKCNNCGAVARKIKREGYSKIFLVPLSGTDARMQVASGHVNGFRSAFEDSKRKSGQAVEGMEREEEDSDEEEEEEKAYDGVDIDEGEGVGRVSAEGARKYLHPLEVKEQMRLLWKAEKKLVARIWGKAPMGMKPLLPENSVDRSRISGLGYEAFFIETIAVPPSKFRPAQQLDGLMFEHPQNVALQKVLGLKASIGAHYAPPSEEEKMNEEEKKEEVDKLGKVVKDWILLQDTVNGFLDSTKGGAYSSELPNGIRQLMEKKSGLFRQNMMGKRVNYAARSVISPDPYIGTDEVGLPVRFATKLSYPEPVTAYNIEMLSNMVRNGAHKHPGALYVEDENGRMIDLSKRNWRQRATIASSLENSNSLGLTEDRFIRASKATSQDAEAFYKTEHNKQFTALSLRGQKRVWRHVQTGDFMLANRQPTLHKPSIMAHKVRVINNASMQTLRLHYANCNTYNADFDGDEMNLHLPQNEHCRAEAIEIAHANRQYCSGTDGEPLRGLIQDHVDMGVLLTQQNTFLTKSEYVQMVFAACSVMGSRAGNKIELLTAAVLKPIPLWTGKQVISTLLAHLVGSTDPADLLTMGPRRSKTSAKMWKVYPTPQMPKSTKVRKVREASLKLIGGADGPLGQTRVVVRQGVLCTGILDKAHFGSSSYGLVHSIYEVYGGNAAGELLSAFAKLFTFCCQKWGHTCAMEDLLLTREAEAARTEEIESSLEQGVATCAKFAGVDEKLPLEDIAVALQRRIRESEGGDPDKDEALLDSKMQATTSATTSAIIEKCLPAGQLKPFPHNCFALMVNSGAKGSLVNHSQISCALGQQALEGRRVPRMISGKSLPCFAPFDPTPRAGGYISDRFLTGIRPQEYYYHCMAGREGLVDTAVKTSRSGYLQRCLVKHMESLSVNYDGTVRADDGSIVQFRYGEDSLNTQETQFLVGNDETLRFLYENLVPLCSKYKVGKGLGLLDLSTETDADQEKRPLQFGLKRAPILHKQVKLMKQVKSLKKIKAGCTVFCRKPKRIRSFKNKEVLEEHFHPTHRPATVIKVHKSSQTKNSGPRRVDVVFEEDSSVVKKIPLWITKRVVAAGTIGKPEGAIRRFASGEEAGLEVRIPLVQLRTPEPVLHQLGTDQHLGSIGEALETKVEDYIARNPDGILKSDDDAYSLKQLLWLKCLKSMAPPGEAVGTLAAQSIGEPSTQMTLNTFHLAGHGGANVTLGIPRLRELLMTASQSIKTPSMTLPLREGISRKVAEKMKGRLYCVKLGELLRSNGGITVKESLVRRSERDLEGQEAANAVRRATDKGQWFRRYTIRFHLHDLSLIRSEFGLKISDIASSIGFKFAQKLLWHVKRAARSAGARLDIASPSKVSKDGESTAKGMDADDLPENPGNKGGSDSEDEDEDEDEDAKKEVDGYDDDSEEEGKDKDEDAASDSSSDSGSDSDSSGSSSGESDDVAKDGVVDTMSTGSSPNESETSSLQLKSKKMKKSMDKKMKTKATTTKVKADRGESFLVAVPATVSKSECWVGCRRSGSKNNEEGWVECTLQFPASLKRLLMLELAGTVAKDTIVRAIKGIDSSFVIDNKDGIAVQTNGCNIPAAWKEAHYIDVSRIASNDIGQILHNYGVEAARAAIIREIKAVFGVYGIGVDPRHMTLIADQMTFEGGYRPFNRVGIEGTTSPLLRMTFESSNTFLTSSALYSESEPLVTPSSRIALGQLIRGGTGAVDLLVPSKST